MRFHCVFFYLLFYKVRILQQCPARMYINVILGSLVDNKGKLVIPGIYDDVAKLTDEERELYDKIEFDMREYAKDIGAQKLLHETKVTDQFTQTCKIKPTDNVSTSATQFSFTL